MRKSLCRLVAVVAVLATSCPLHALEPVFLDWEQDPRTYKDVHYESNPKVTDSFEQVSSPTNPNDHVLKVTAGNDSITGSEKKNIRKKIRAEFRVDTDYPKSGEACYSMDVYIDANSYLQPGDVGFQLITQVHNRPPDRNWSQSEVTKEHPMFSARVGMRKNEAGSNEAGIRFIMEPEKKGFEYPFPPNAWHTIETCFKLSTRQDGYVKVAVDGQPAVDFKGVTNYSPGNNPINFKGGLYEGRPEDGNRPNRTIYVGNFMIAGSKEELRALSKKHQGNTVRP